MKRPYSLRGRLYLALAVVFAIGFAASAVYYHFEIREIHEELSQSAPEASARLDARLDSGQEAYEYVGYVFLPFGLFCSIAIVWTSVWSLRPILRAAADLERSDRFGRLDVGRLPTEVRPFAESVNSALDRLQQAYESEKRFTASAAHQLRTPVTVLALRIQKARLEGNPDWPALEQDVGHLTRIVSQLLDLARKESGHRTETLQLVNIARTTREAAATVLPLAEDLGRRLEVTAPDSVLVRGYAGHLSDMIRNLLENALLHGRGAVQAEVTVGAGSAVPEAVLTVVDEGAGVPAELREAMFERFQKGDASSPGAGLGLAIVREVARAHGGDVSFLPTAQCRVEVRIPLHPGNA